MRVVSEKRIGTPQPTAEKTKNLEPMSSTALIALKVQTMLRHMMVIQENMDKFEKRPKQPRTVQPRVQEDSQLQTMMRQRVASRVEKAQLIRILPWRFLIPGRVEQTMIKSMMARMLTAPRAVQMAFATSAHPLLSLISAKILVCRISHLQVVLFTASSASGLGPSSSAFDSGSCSASWQEKLWHKVRINKSGNG